MFMFECNFLPPLTVAGRVRYTPCTSRLVPLWVYYWQRVMLYRIGYCNIALTGNGSETVRFEELYRDHEYLSDITKISLLFAGTIKHSESREWTLLSHSQIFVFQGQRVMLLQQWENWTGKASIVLNNMVRKYLLTLCLGKLTSFVSTVHVTG